MNISSGSIQRFYIHSEWVDCRNIDVWLPENFSAGKKYPVLYMHDGQMLFDSSNAWNKKEWKVDETAGELIAQNKIREVIIVGIWHNGNKRHSEYFPQKSIDYIAEPQRSNLISLMPDGPLADNYLRFIVTELKPFIDSTFPTYPDQAHTFIAGSSMGGLISLYALCEYPEIFSGAACLSSHWIGGFDYNVEIPTGINEYLKNKLPDPAKHKIYFDHGTVGLDANYPDFQKLVDSILKQKKYSDQTTLTLVFPGDDHNENCWSARLDRPLIFLLKL